MILILMKPVLQQSLYLSFNGCYFNSGLPHVTNFTLADVSWLLDYYDSENQLVVVPNESLINNSTYLVGELPKNLEVRSGFRNDGGNSHSKMYHCEGCLYHLYREKFEKET
jgi:hypothetical protein